MARRQSSEGGERGEHIGLVKWPQTWRNGGGHGGRDNNHKGRGSWTSRTNMRECVMSKDTEEKNKKKMESVRLEKGGEYE